jgi:hypothetical protein
MGDELMGYTVFKFYALQILTTKTVLKYVIYDEKNSN